MEAESFEVVMAGSLLTRGDRGWISAPVEKALRIAAPQASLLKLELEPVVGAIWCAMERDGRIVTAQIYEQMRHYRDFHSI
ncbi:hypothetical protein [Paenibacillus beijingensis]|uniref:hypothetical protein n=1 Tax=Paenibacillus beijingensis TaxID=1126833 RepID=UPI000A541A31